MSTFLIFIFALSLLVFVHEWGHFIVAKLAGIRVDVFSIGFGPKILGFTWHGTEYRVAPFPFGGYVKIYGQDPYEEAEGSEEKAAEIAKDPESFASKSIWAKLAVVFAGPVMNLVLCFLFMPMVFMAGRMEQKILSETPVVQAVQTQSTAATVLQQGDQILSFNDVVVNTWQDLLTQIALHPDEDVHIKVKRADEIVDLTVRVSTHPESKQVVGYLGIEPFHWYDNAPVVGDVSAGKPAALAGIQTGDQILAINEKQITYWNEVPEIVRSSDGSPLSLQIKRGDEVVALQVAPQKDEELDAYLLGIGKKTDESLYELKRHGFSESIVLGTEQTVKLLGLTFDILKRLFTAQLSWKTLGGPFQIASASATAWRDGLGSFLFLLAFLSMQLGIMNLLPVPVLDGGHIVLITVEGILGRGIPQKLKSALMIMGVVALLSLMLVVTVNDVDNLFGLGLLQTINKLF